LAGFVDAEGSFGVRPTNAGRSWVCDFRLSQRDDDASVLARIQRLTGLGVLTPYPARANSKPQTTWSIRSQIECLRLVQILEEFPLRGRKQREFVVWAEAVTQWNGRRRERAAAMRHASERLRCLRRYVDPPLSTAPPHDSQHLRWYLGGFFSGEGYFGLSQRSARAVIKVRRDDLPLLQAFAGSTTLGTIMDVSARGSSRPGAVWIIQRHGQLSAAIDLLESAMLRGRRSSYRRDTLIVYATKLSSPLLFVSLPLRGDTSPRA
jgi:hypothetical protein